MDYCSYVNVFQGNGEIDLPKPEGIAATWFFIKAQCGNTTPAATGPFGAMSVNPYTGGYPTGYGNHFVNTHGAVRKIAALNEMKGFTHLHQSGTGAIKFYYNFLLITPRRDTGRERFAFSDEKAEPGYYACTLDGDIKCEVTACKKVGAHRYDFGDRSGFATIDFTQQGLDLPDNSAENQPKAEVVAVKTVSEKCIALEIKTEGISLYFALDTDGEITVDGNKATVTPDGNILNIRVAVSSASCDKAVDELKNAGSFDEIKSRSHDEWNECLSHFDITTDDEKIREIYYSNLYHSLVKPADFDGESFVYDEGRPFITDFATLWDMYKTQLPLIFMSYKEMGEKICETILLLGEKLGEIPNAFGLNSKYTEHSTQARMLGDYVLLTAYRYGLPIDPDRMLKVITADIFADNKKDFTVDGRCASHTWMLDMADGCALAAQLAEETGDRKTAEKLRPLAAQWINAFDAKTGLLDADSSYYEGTLYNYSFRQMVEMDKRIELAGGKERFTKLLDDFFGYGKAPVTQVTDPKDRDAMDKGMALGRFEGLNNESDTESPFSYIYADRHDRTCEVVTAGLKYQFTTGRGGIPGNNDTGALSSWYCLVALGLFPVAGQDLFLLASPVVDGAAIKLYNGKELKITVHNQGEDNIYVMRITFNGNEITDYRLTAKELFNGGELVFYKTDKKGE